MHREGFVEKFRVGRAGKHSRRVGRVTVLLFVFALVLSSQVAALAGGTTAGDKFLTDGAADSSMKALEALAEVELPGGGQIMFVPILNARGDAEGVMVAEAIGPRMQSMRSVEGMTAATPLEIFNAFADDDQRAPKLLVELYGKNSKLGRHGWARDLVAERPLNIPIPCAPNNTDQVGLWGDDLDAYADLFGHENPFKSTYDGPVEKPSHWSGPFHNGFDSVDYYELNGQANDVTGFYTSVIFCSEDQYDDSTYNGNYVGNYVNVSWRIAGHGGWAGTMNLGQLDEVGKIIQYAYVPANWNVPSATTFDFHLELTQAKTYDQFHIGATWYYGGPSDFKSPN